MRSRSRFKVAGWRRHGRALHRARKRAALNREWDNKLFSSFSEFQKVLSQIHTLLKGRPQIILQGYYIFDDFEGPAWGPTEKRN